MTFKKSSIKIQANLSTSKALKSKKSNNPTSKGRKSLTESKNSVKSKVNHDEALEREAKSGVIPFTPTLSVDVYKIILLIYRGLKRQVNGFGVARFGFDCYMCLLSMYCFGRVGCSLTALCLSIHFSDSSIVLDNVYRVVNRLVNYGLIDKVGNRYFISSHAEKIFKDLFSADDVREFGLVLRDAKRYDREVSARKKAILKDRYFGDDGL